LLDPIEEWFDAVARAVEIIAEADRIVAIALRGILAMHRSSWQAL
jgi:hypothetical protein